MTTHRAWLSMSPNWKCPVPGCRTINDKNSTKCQECQLDPSILTEDFTSPQKPNKDIKRRNLLKELDEIEVPAKDVCCQKARYTSSLSPMEPDEDEVKRKLRRDLYKFKADFHDLNSEFPFKKKSTLEDDLKEVILMKMSIRDLRNDPKFQKKVDAGQSMLSRSIFSILKEAKVIIGKMNKLKEMDEARLKAICFYETCIEMEYYSDDSLKDHMMNAKKAAASALYVKLTDYCHNFPVQELHGIYAKISRELYDIPEKEKKVDKNDIGIEVEDALDGLQFHEAEVEEPLANEFKKASEKALEDLEFALISMADVTGLSKVPPIGELAIKARKALEQEHNSILMSSENHSQIEAPVKPWKLLWKLKNYVESNLAIYEENYQKAENLKSKLGLCLPQELPEKEEKDVKYKQKSKESPSTPKKGKTIAAAFGDGLLKKVEPEVKLKGKTEAEKSPFSTPKKAVVTFDDGLSEDEDTDTE